MTNGDGITWQAGVVVDDGNVYKVNAVAHPGQRRPYPPGKDSVCRPAQTLHRTIQYRILDSVQ